MILIRMVPASPFVRKVRIAAAYLDLGDRVRFVDAEEDAGDSLRSRNPLNKIPVALLEDGTTVFDSRVILEMLDHLAGGGRILPTDMAVRLRALTTQALADGILDAAVLIGYETRYREPHQKSPRWLEMQHGKIDRALDAAAAGPPTGPIHVGHIALACALGFLDLRLDGVWRNAQPALVPWLDDFAARVPAFEATRASR